MLNGGRGKKYNHNVVITSICLKGGGLLLDWWRKKGLGKGKHEWYSQWAHQYEGGERGQKSRCVQTVDSMARVGGVMGW